MSSAATAPTRPDLSTPTEHGLPIGPLTEWLRSHAEAPAAGWNAPLRVAPLAGGQSNPTYRLQIGDRRWVLRRKPPGVLLASAHAVEREYRVMRALAATDVPVPAVHALCEDPSVIGSAFYLMDFVDGRVLPDPTLPGFTPAGRAAIYDAMNATIAAIHRVNPAAVGLADYGRPDGFVARQLDRWTRQYRAAAEAAGEDLPAMDRLIPWLEAHRPRDASADAVSLVHGDFRIDNLVFHPDEPRVLAVLDWELSTLGHPVSDFAYHAMAWRVGADEFRGMRGADLPALGIPSEAAYVAAWLRRTGLPAAEGLPDAAQPPHWRYHLVFNMFRMAAILHGILARHRQGNAAAADAEATGRRARPMAEAGWRLAQAG